MGTSNKVRQFRCVLRLEIVPGKKKVAVDESQFELLDDITACVDRLQEIFDCEKNCLAANAARMEMGKILRVLNAK